MIALAVFAVYLFYSRFVFYRQMDLLDLVCAAFAVVIAYKFYAIAKGGGGKSPPGDTDK